MENDENLDLELEQQDEETEESVEETDAEGQEIDPKDAEIAQAKAEAAKYRRLLEKATKPKVVTQQAPSQQASPTNVEETVLLANGMSEELLEQLKKVAQVQGLSLIKAQNDPIFVAVKENFDKKQKAEAASMGASRGSGSAKPKKDFSTPGLSRDEHKAMARAAMQ